MKETYNIKEIIQTLHTFKGNIAKSAISLDIAYQNLYSKINRTPELLTIIQQIKLKKINEKEHNEERRISLRPSIIKSEKRRNMKKEMQQEVRKKGVSETEIKNCLDKFNGNISKCSDGLNLTYAVLYRKVRNSPILKEHLEVVKQKIVDMAEEVIIEKLEERDEKVAMFVLETKGKDQGYTKKSIKELTGVDGGAIEIENTIVSIVKDATATIDTILNKIV